LVSPKSISPSREDVEVIGTFNPGAVRTFSEVVLLIRVVERPRQMRPGFVGLPRWELGDGITIDWVARNQFEYIDARVVRMNADGQVRLTYLLRI
jgi:predicted GH43/DUF377 family glycosyl hydrolase